MSFQNAVDIANRALDHVGADPIDTTLGFTEPSKNTRICARVYDKVRKAELRRNIWRFAIRKAILRAIDANTMLLAPSLWSSFPTYFVGSIVSDSSGQLWISQSRDNLNHQPGNGEALGIPPVPPWIEYFGPMTVSLYSSGTSYSAGELVYTTAGDGTNRTYLSLQNANSDNPATATAWNATAVYFKNQVVTFSSVAYMSRIDLNTNQTPTASAADWDSGTVYGASAAVTGSDGVRYTSIAGGNLGNDPVLTFGFWTNTGILTPWTTVFSGGTGSLKWLQIGGAEFPFGVALTTLNIIYPVGTGPSTEITSRNVYRLPAGFLRKASSDPKAGSNTFMGSDTSLLYNDWLFEGNYITTIQTDPIMLRFVADTVDVPNMDDMFCEGLAARMGLEICEPITQSSQKLTTIAGVYALQMGDARLVNGIEVGPEEAPTDDYIACRY
jgi:hypothetical protein